MYYKVRSSHGTSLAFEGPTGKLVACAAHVQARDQFPIYAFIPEADRELVVLVAARPEAEAPTPGSAGIVNRLLIVRAAAKGDLTRVTLLDPFTRLYASASPLASGHSSVEVHFNRTHAFEWEMFSFEAVGELFVPAPITAIRGVIETVLSDEELSDGVLRFALTSGDLASDALLTALLPLLSLTELQTIASALLDQPDFLGGLGQRSPSDPWASLALPELAAWCKARVAPRARPPVADTAPRRWFGLLRGKEAVTLPPPPAPDMRSQTRHVVGTEYDVFEYAGSSGQFASFWHAVSVYTRAAISPRKKLCILATARNEGVYFLEWIAYHRSIGVQHFFIYSNDNDDGSDELLECLAKAREITWFDSKVTPGRGAQPKAYGHAFNVLPEILDYRWCFTLDLDEFFVFDPDRFSSLPDFLAWQERREVDAVAVNWVFVGADQESTWRELPLSRRNRKLLTRNQVGEGYRLVKTVSQPRKVTFSYPHHVVTDERRSLIYRDSSGGLHAHHNPPGDFPANPQFADCPVTYNASVYHYMFKSADEYLWKSSRNRGDHPMTKGITAPDTSPEFIVGYLHQNDATEVELDTHMQRCCATQDQEIMRLLSLEGVGRAYSAVRDQYTARIQELKARWLESIHDQPYQEHLARFRQILNPL